MEYSVLDIAKYFVQSGVLINHKKLQKMVYYAYSWYLVKNNGSIKDINNRLFKNKIEAWVHGPVCPDLYYAYNENKIFEYKSKPIDEKTIKILNLIIETYGKYTGEELEKMTHREAPWINARNGCLKFERSNKKIKDEDIYEFYSSKIM